MSQSPYNPMHPPEKFVSFEQMQAILQKHAPNHCEAELFKAAQSPQEPQAPQGMSESLKWRKLGENSWESNKGPVLLIEGAHFFVFDRKSGDGHTAKVIGRFSDGKTAKDFVRLLP